MSESANMLCPICDGEMFFFIEKIFNKYGLEKVTYIKCENCGFVQSKTHKDMTQEQWEKLNKSYHESFFGLQYNPDDPNWLSRLTLQADIINDIASANLLPRDLPWLDYGCGDGKLADTLNSLNLPTLKYDRYITNSEFLSDTQLYCTKYSLVINNLCLNTY